MKSFKFFVTVFAVIVSYAPVKSFANSDAGFQNLRLTVDNSSDVQLISERVERPKNSFNDFVAKNEMVQYGRSMVLKGGSQVTKYGVDFLNYKNDNNPHEIVRLRGGINKLSPHATAGIQLIVQW